MREIKFRGRKNGTWYTIDFSDSQRFAREVLESMRDGDRILEFDFPMRQYTGLKDKNGKEVYDGDIIRFKDFTDIITAEVEWGTGQWQYKPKGWITGYSSVMVGGNIEVIGNIYDNPELLQ